MVDTVRAPWIDRPGPWYSRAVYSWVLTFSADQELDRLHAAYQPLVSALPGLRPVPRNWLHVAIQAIGYTYRVTQDELDPIIESARARLQDIPAFAARFEPARVGPVSLRLPMRPIQPLRQLRVHLRTAITEHWGPDSLPELPDLDPNLVLGYWTTVAAAAPLRDQVATADPLPAVTTQIRTVSLVNLLPADRQYEWIPYTSLPLST